MNNIERHYFPGNNTPKGFFSYYNYVLDRKDARKIWYLKGGPGTGKSTLIKKIGYAMLEKGCCVDFLHCSSDSDSLDGIVLRKEGLAIIDGTPPHGIDPVNPGAVDSIINLGEYWDEECIREKRLEIIETKDSISNIFKKAYNYLCAAEKMYDNLQLEKGRRISRNVALSVSEEIIDDAMGTKQKITGIGKERKFFASAVTPQGIRNFTHQVVLQCEKVYVIIAPIASGCEEILSRVFESAIDRGLEAEAFYCSIKPDSKIDHLVVPERSFALITSNKYHEFEYDRFDGKTVIFDLNGFKGKPDENTSLQTMDFLIGKAIECLKSAKGEHDKLEAIYNPCMYFEGIDETGEKIMASCHFKNLNV